MKSAKRRNGGAKVNAAQKLKLIVNEKGVTYTSISSKTGIPVDAISKSLLGKRRLPADEMIAICKAAGIDLDDLAHIDLQHTT